MTCVATGFLVLVTMSSWRLEFKSKQRVVHYSHVINAIFALMGITCQASHYWSSQISQLYYTDDHFLLK